VNKAQGPLAIDDIFAIIDMSSESWRAYINSQEDKMTLDEVRKHTLTGRPLGTRPFVEKLEK